MCNTRNESVLIAASFACLSVLSLLVGGCLKGATQVPAKQSSVARQNASQMELVFNFRHKRAKQSWTTACCAYGGRISQ